MKKFLTSIALFTISIALPVFAQDPVPLFMNFQGKLTDSNQVPLNEQKDITLSIYDVDDDGDPETVDTPLWSEDHTNVDVVDGIFNVLIGDGTPDPANTGDLSTVLTGEDRWLEVHIVGDDDGPLTPRQWITSAAYSIHSSTAVNADDVLDKDINPNSVTIPAFGQVIDSAGQWVGDPTGLIGPQGPQGPKGDSYNDISSYKLCVIAGSPGNIAIPFPSSWTNNTCRTWCDRSLGWQRYHIWLASNGGGLSIIVPFGTSCP